MIITCLPIIESYLQSLGFEKSQMKMYSSLFSAINKWLWFMVFNTTFNNISVILWRSVSLVEEIGVTGENHSIKVRIWIKTLKMNMKC